MMRRILAAFGLVNDWVQDPVGLATILLGLLLVAIIYMGLSKLIQ